MERVHGVSALGHNTDDVTIMRRESSQGTAVKDADQDEKAPLMSHMSIKSNFPNGEST